MRPLTKLLFSTPVLILTSISLAAPVFADTPQQCYARDSACTQMCSNAAPDWKYECFNRCDIYLNNCLDRGVWTDQNLSLDPGSSNPNPKPKISVQILDHKSISVAQ